MALYNTDVYGIVRAFHDAFRTHGMTLPAQPNAVILGNGNTATSALAGCITMGCSQVTVAARHPDRSTALIDLGAAHGVTVRSIPLEDCLPALEQCDIAISTIPGTGADVVARRFAEHAQPIHGALLDVVYDPRPTELMVAWRDRGGLAIGGERMLLHQAVAQVLLMTGTIGGDDVDDALNNPPQTGTLEQAMWEALEKEL